MSERKANVALVRPYFATIEHGVKAEVELSGDATVGDVGTRPLMAGAGSALAAEVLGAGKAAGERRIQGQPQVARVDAHDGPGLECLVVRAIAQEAWPSVTR